jgi:hypothetical protein
MILNEEGVIAWTKEKNVVYYISLSRPETLSYGNKRRK